DGSGITRDSGFGTVLMGPNSTMELTYLDMDGNTLTLPITNTDVINSLRAIRVTVNLTSEQSLSTGTPYIATVSQTFGLRNLNYLY
ncbi:MAG: hypothetical protein KDD53_06285, partial [Bdellovibrionales bacterium]|nr:hypothetical protein [Bdellovibrionales bacterium]